MKNTIVRGLCGHFAPENTKICPECEREFRRYYSVQDWIDKHPEEYPDGEVLIHCPS